MQSIKWGRSCFVTKNIVFSDKRLKKSVRSRPEMVCINIYSFYNSLFDIHFLFILFFEYQLFTCYCVNFVSKFGLLAKKAITLSGDCLFAFLAWLKSALHHVTLWPCLTNSSAKEAYRCGLAPSAGRLSNGLQIQISAIFIPRYGIKIFGVKL